MTQSQWYLLNDKKQYALALCSNAGSDFLRLILKRNKIEELFPVLDISGEVGVIKPDRRIYEMVLEKMGLNAEEVIFIDDRQVNLDGAKTVGIRGIQFTSLEQFEEDFLRLDIHT